MAYIIGDLVNRFNVDDGNNPLYQLSGTDEVRTITIGGRTFIYAVGRGEGGGVSGFELMPDGTVIGVVNLSTTDLPALAGSMHSQSVTIGGSTYLYVNGGDEIVAFEVETDGDLTHIQTVQDTSTIFLDQTIGRMGLVQVEGVNYLISGGTTDDGITSFAVAGDGTLSIANSLAAGASGGAFAPSLFGPQNMSSAVVSGNTFLFVPDSTSSAINVIQVGAGGTFTTVDIVFDGLAPDLKLEQAFGTATAVIGGLTYLYVGSALEGGISVFQVSSSGALTNTSNYGDGSGEFLQEPSDLTAFELDGQTFLAVSNLGDEGVITLLGVEGDGSLTFVQEFEDTSAVNLERGLTNTFTMIDGKPMLIAGGFTDSGFSTFEIGPNDDALTGTDEADTIMGLGGDDSIMGLRGDDSILGGDGDDSLDGGVGADTIRGGDGDDMILGGGDLNMVAIPTLVLNTDGNEEHYADITNYLMQSGDFTIEMLYKSAGTPPSIATHYFHYEIDGPQGVNQLSLFGRENGDGEIALTFYNTNYTGSGIPSERLFDGELHRISLTFDASAASAELYIDGVLEHTFTGLVTPGTQPGLQTGGTLNFGQEQDGEGANFDSRQNLRGEIADIRIWSDVRSGAEIAKNAFVPIGNPLIEQGLVENWQPDPANSLQVPSETGGTVLTIRTGGGEPLPGFGTFAPVSSDDLVYDGRGDDTVMLGGGDDTVVAGGGADSYVGGDGDDYVDYFNSSGGVSFDLATDSATGSWSNNDTIEGFEGAGGSNTGDDTIYGTDGDNLIRGNGGDDRVYALGGDDTVELGEGDDYVRAAEGANRYDGGGGDADYISYYDAPDGIILGLDAPFAVGNWGGADTVSGFEGASGSNTGGDNISGTAGDNIIRTYGGNDGVDALGGNDTVELGSGNDVAVASGGVSHFDGGADNDTLAIASGVGVDLDLAANTVEGGTLNDVTFERFESAIGSFTGDDTISGTSGDNTILGFGGDDRVFDRGGDDSVDLGEGDDYVRAGGGADTYRGGMDNDYISYFDSSGGIDITLGDGDNMATGSWANNDLVIGFEGVSGSNTGDDTVEGSAGANIIRTYGEDDYVADGGGDDSVVLGDGQDTLEAGPGQDTYKGGDGNDLIDYFFNSVGVDLDLAANTVSGGEADDDTIEDFESAVGSEFGDDTISGTSGENTLKGEGGNDRVFDRGGADSVELGAGDDYVRAGGGADSYDGGADDDYISYYDSSGGVNLDFRTDLATGSWANNDSVVNFEGASGSNTGDDTLRGDDGASTLRGYGGNDRLHGHGGDDSLVGGDGNDSLYGSSGADTMRGGDGADYFDGGGGSGTDLLYGDAGEDVFHFDRGEGDDVIKDFENNIDTIEFDNFSFTTAADALALATQTGDDVLFDFGSNGTLLVEDATIAQLGNDIDIV